MTMLGRTLFFGRAFQPEAGNNAAPSILPVTLNFDLRANSAPDGDNKTLVFEVSAFFPNNPPTGASQALVYEVEAA